MYNKNIKEEYLANKSESIKCILTNIFNKSEIYEEMKGKDICNFIENEILEFLMGFASCSISTLACYTSLLRSYTWWCCDNDISVDHMNHYDMITLNMMGTCVNKILDDSKYITLEELKTVMEAIVNVGDKALVYSMFYGICGKDCIELTGIKSEDIDTVNNIVKLCTGRQVVLPVDLCYMLSTSCEMYDYFLTTIGKFSSLKLHKEDLSPFKRRANARFSTQEKARLRIISRLTKLREDTGCIALTMDRLRNSGMIHHMKQAMKNNPELNKENIFSSKEMQKIQEQYNCINVMPFTLRARFKEYL